MNSHPTSIDIKAIAKALFVINKNSKTALNPHVLYELKRQVIKKLLSEGLAKKIAIHRFPGRRSVNTFAVNVKVEDYYFHIPATKDDFKNLPIISVNDNFRNEKVYDFTLKQSKNILYDFLNYDEKELNKKPDTPPWQSSPYLSYK